jgi:hypothetical protein
MAQKLIRKTYQADTKAAEGQDRTLIVTISTSSPDRSQDVVVPSGMISDKYMKNPVVAAFHRYSEPAIAKTLELQVTDNAVIAKLQFPPQGIYEKADQLYELYKAGFMNAWSIGFIPKEAVDLDPDRPYSGGHRFEKWELLEYSAVLVPDNPEALTMLRSKGIEEEPSDEETKVVEVDVEADREQSAQATKDLEEKAATVGIEVKGVTLDVEDGTYVLDVVVDGKEHSVTYPIPDDVKEKLRTGAEHPAAAADVSKALSALRDALKPADKEIGLVLRSLKTLLDQPSK